MSLADTRHNYCSTGLGPKKNETGKKNRSLYERRTSHCTNHGNFPLIKESNLGLLLDKRISGVGLLWKILKVNDRWVFQASPRNKLQSQEVRGLWLKDSKVAVATKQEKRYFRISYFVFVFISVLCVVVFLFQAI